MNKLTTKHIVLVALLCLCSTLSMAKTTLYHNNFNGQGTGSNTLPSGTGLLNSNFIPPLIPATGAYAADCKFTLKGGSLSSDCVMENVPPAGEPGNLYTFALSPILSVADPSSPTNQLIITSNEDILTFEFKIAYAHDVTSKASKAQAQYYTTDVNDGRLGFGFVAVASSNSPATLCFAITANKIIAYVDGLSQTSSSDTNPGYNFVSEKELAHYTPGKKVEVKIQVDKLNHTGTYYINGVKKLVVHLDGPLPGPGLTVTAASTLSDTIRNNSPTLDGWRINWLPVVSPLSDGSLGSASGRYTRGGLLAQQFIQSFYGLGQNYPLSWLKTFNSWTNPNSFVFGKGTQYKMELQKIKVYGESGHSQCDVKKGH